MNRLQPAGVGQGVTTPLVGAFYHHFLQSLSDRFLMRQEIPVGIDFYVRQQGKRPVSFCEVCDTLARTKSSFFPATFCGPVGLTSTHDHIWGGGTIAECPFRNSSCQNSQETPLTSHRMPAVAIFAWPSLQSGESALGYRRAFASSRPGCVRFHRQCQIASE